MSRYKHIMVVVDPAMRRSTAFRRGVALAKRSGARLTLLLVTYNAAIVRAGLVDPDMSRRAVHGYLASRRRWLEAEAQALGQQGVDAVPLAVWHRRPHAGIAEQALELRPDLVIRDIQPSSAIERAMFTPADWHLLRLCPAPLMLVDEDAGTVPQRILAAVDLDDLNDKPGELNDEIVAAALQMASVSDGIVHIVHALGIPAALAPLGVEPVAADATFHEQLRRRGERELEAFGDRHGIPPERRHLLEGEPKQVIPSLARDLTVDLAVLGAVQRGGLQRAFMGATAEDVLHELDCDVLVLKPARFEAALRKELAQEDAES